MTPETVAVPIKKRRLRGRWLALAIVILIVGGIAGAGYAFRRTLTSPSLGTIVPTVPQNAREPQVELAQYDGTSVSFVHPMPYIEQNVKQAPIANEIESHLFISSGIISKQLQLTVSKLPSGNLDDDASYYMRTQNSAKYKMKTTQVKNEKVVIFTHYDGQQYSQTAFWPHAGKLLTFNMAGLNTDVPAMTVEFNDMVNSIKWR